MNEIRYNQTSTVGRLALAGILATQLLPVSEQPYAGEQNVKGSSRAIYRTTGNSATYSLFNNSIAGWYTHSIETEYSWLTPELVNFLSHSQQVSLESLGYLLAKLRDAFGSVGMSVAIHTDPEEGWVKPVVAIHSGVDDFDKLLDIEDDFFTKAANDPTLLTILPHVVISQA